jgi:phosphatidylethanolamine/phosphatidyl-N-methylethanolamine N-methyltransferase
MNNQWNQFIYKIWSPFYDRLFNKGPFLKARKRLFQSTFFKPSDKILFVGVGTGADIQQISHHQLDITAIDYSQDMLKRAEEKFPNSSITFIQMDAQQLHFPSESFDYVIGSLILSVVPDGQKALKEMIRVTKENGHILIFDKFAPKDRNNSLGKGIIRQVVKILGTDIGRSFEGLYKGSMKSTLILEDEDMMFNGMYRKIVLQKLKER